MTFRKYEHVERYGNIEVEDIQKGLCYIFPKLDGTNSSIWSENHCEHCDDEIIKAGSRNRTLSLENDNGGFYQEMMQRDNIKCFFAKYPDHILYGEWLIPHTLKTYRDDAWREFYIFDVYDKINNKFMIYDDYKPLMDDFELIYIPPIAIIRNPSYEQLIHHLENLNTYLIKDGHGVGEGIAIKNYQYVNRYGRYAIAKIVRNEFKEQNQKEFDQNVKGGSYIVESDIITVYCTEALVEKTYAKIVTENDGWTSKNIGELLGRVFHDIVKENIWNIVNDRRFKKHAINFTELKKFCIMKIKEIKPELF